MPSKRAAVRFIPRLGHVWVTSPDTSPPSVGAQWGRNPLVRPRSRPLDHRKLAGQAAFFTSGARWNRTIGLSIISAAL